MDILNLIKSEHDRLKNKMSSILESGNKTDKRLFAAYTKDLDTHFKIEKDYIYPEAQTLSAVTSWVKREELNQQNILQEISSLDISCVDMNQLVSLAKKIEAHFRAEEDLLMPKFRSSLSFDQREEFGEALIDYQQELYESI